MASTVPAKSQPLHNFPLSHLNWTAGHQRPRSSASAARLSSPSPHRSPQFSHHGSPQRHSPLRQSLPPQQHSPCRAGESASVSSPGGGGSAADSASPQPVMEPHSPIRPGASDDLAAAPFVQSPIYDGPAAGKLDSIVRNEKPLIEYRRQSRNSVSSRVKSGIFAPDRDNSIEGKSDKKSKAAAPELDNKEARSSKILIKIRPIAGKVSEENQAGEAVKSEESEVQEEGKLFDAFDDEEPLPKIWNLRPRKPIKKSLNVNGSGFNNNESSTLQEQRSQSPQVNPNGNNNRSDAQKMEKRKIGFALTLSREEIDEDIYSLLGSKLTRRPKKKQRNAQKLLNNLFPGAWLQSVTADSYKVSEHPGKC